MITHVVYKFKNIMNHMKNFFYLVCTSVSTVYAGSENKLNLEIKDLKTENEKLLEENAELQVEKEDLLAQIKHLKTKKCPEQKAPIQAVEPKIQEPVEPKKSYLDRAKEKVHHLMNTAKGMFRRS